MRKKLAVLVGALVLAGATGALAGPGQGPDPYGPAAYGLCKAYFANGGNGNSHNAPPFRNLQEAAAENDQEVAEFCDGIRPSNGQGQGRQDDSSAPNPIG